MLNIQVIEYHLDDITYEGVMCWDNSITGKRPGLLVSHAWFGQGDFEIQKTKDLASLGFVAFALDMYGKGRRAKNPEEASKLMHECVDDRIELRSRILNALATLKKNELVDHNRLGAIGFCFGGRCVLDLARTGIDIKGVASFHGIYDQPNIEYTDPINAAVLVLHGWDDPLATPEQTIALGNELTERKADWQIVAMGHTGHAFTNPLAAAPETGMAYQADSNRRAWRSMSNFFEELFA